MPCVNRRFTQGPNDMLKNFRKMDASRMSRARIENTLLSMANDAGQSRYAAEAVATVGADPSLMATVAAPAQYRDMLADKFDELKAVASRSEVA